MPFISYAQNFEDVMLWRALKSVKRGFYIDVGANHPEVDSVTKAFYEYGWSGINIEPVSLWFDKLEQERPRDVNLRIAAGKTNGTLVLFEIPDTGLSTSCRATAERHNQERGYNFIERVVPVQRLTDICAAYHVGEVHFLKIDVEGAEREVLEGIDFDKIRPWVLVIEATLPNQPIVSYEEWEHIVIEAGYQCVYFDGMNRFYVPAEKIELKEAFCCPPNVFDDFQSDSERKAINEASLLKDRQLLLDRRIAELETTIQDYQRVLLDANATIQRLDAKVHQAERKMEMELHNVYSSRSWRMTKPLRQVARCARNTRGWARRIVRFCVQLAIAGLSSRPRTRTFCASLARHVGLYGVLRAVRSHFAEQDEMLPRLNIRLTIGANSIYTDIKGEIDRQQRRKDRCV